VAGERIERAVEEIIRSAEDLGLDVPLFSPQTHYDAVATKFIGTDPALYTPITKAAPNIAAKPKPALPQPAVVPPVKQAAPDPRLPTSRRFNRVLADAAVGALACAKGDDMGYSPDELRLKLGPRASRGSKPRCHIMTDGSPKEVARRLNEIAAPFALVTEADRWMPLGFSDTSEAELDKAVDLLDAENREQLRSWWLPENYPRARTPNFDIASTARIDNRRGLLLIEAKAHGNEIRGETVGRRRKPRNDGSPEETPEYRDASGETIGRAIADARDGLRKATGFHWGIDRDRCYQMSNRFAWAWRLTELGVPVVLVYLGFLNALEMNDVSPAFGSAADWEREVLAHSAGIVPPEIWGRTLEVNNQPFTALIRAVVQPL